MAADDIIHLSSVRTSNDRREKARDHYGFGAAEPVYFELEILRHQFTYDHLTP
jgi:hypothetical protein